MSLELWKRSNKNMRPNGNTIWTASVALLATLFVTLMVMYAGLLTGCDDAADCCVNPTNCGPFDLAKCDKPENEGKVFVPVPTETCPKCEECIEPGTPPTCNETATCVTPFGKCVSDCVKTHGANKYGRCVKACRKTQA